MGADLASTGRSIALAERYPFIYAAVGVHPDGVGELNEENFQWLREQCAHPKAVAVGEIGLDYYWDTVPRQQQREWFGAADGAGSGDEAAGHHPQPGGRPGDVRAYQPASCPYHRWCHPLLFLFEGNGAGICENGLLYRDRRRGDVKNARKLKETAEAVPLSSILLEIGFAVSGARCPTGENGIPL